MSNLYEQIPYMSPDAFRAFLKASNGLFDSHTKKNIGYEDINGEQYYGSTDNFGSEMLIESRKLRMENPPIKSLFTNNTFDQYFHIQFSPLLNTYGQSNMLSCILKENVLLSNIEYHIEFTNCIDCVILRSESSSDPDVKKDTFIKTTTPPVLVLHDPNGINPDISIDLILTDDTEIDTTYYFGINITTNDIIQEYDTTTRVLKTKTLSKTHVGFSLINVCVDIFNEYPSLTFENNVDNDNNPLLVLGTNGHMSHGLYPLSYGITNVPSMTDPDAEGEWFIKVNTNSYSSFVTGINNQSNFIIPITDISYVHSISITSEPDTVHTVSLEDQYVKMTLSREINWQFRKPAEGDYDYNGTTYANPVYAYIRLSALNINTEENEPMKSLISFVFDNGYLTPYENKCGNAVTGIHIDGSSDYSDNSIDKKNGIVHDLGDFDGLPKYFKYMLKRAIHRAHVEMYCIRDNVNRINQEAMDKQTAAVIIDSAVPNNETNYVLDALNMCITYNPTVGRLFEKTDESVSPYNMLSEIVYIDKDHFGSCNIPKYSMSKKFVYHGNRVFSLGKTGFDPEIEIARVYGLMNDECKYDNNALSDNPKPSRTMACMYDIPTSFVQLIHIVGEYPTIIIDKLYVHTDCSFTDDDKIRIWNGGEERFVSKEINYGTSTRRKLVFNDEENLDTVLSKSYIESNYKKITNINQHINLSTSTHYEFTVNTGGSGYHVNDKFNCIIGGITLTGTVTSIIGSSVNGISMDIPNDTCINIGNIPLQISTFGTTSIVGSGLGLKINLDIDNIGWASLCSRMINSYDDLYTYKFDKFGNIFVWNYNPSSFTWEKGYQLTGVTVPENEYDDFNTQKQRSTRDVFINTKLNYKNNSNVNVWKYPLKENKQTLSVTVYESNVNNDVDLSLPTDLSLTITDHNDQDSLYVINNKADAGDPKHGLVKYTMFPGINSNKLTLPRFNQLNLFNYYNKSNGFSIDLTNQNIQPMIYVYDPKKNTVESTVMLCNNMMKVSSSHTLTFVDVLKADNSKPETLNVFNATTGQLNRNIYRYNDYSYEESVKDIIDLVSGFTRVELIQYITEHFGEDVEPIIYETSVDYRYTEQMLVDYIKTNTLPSPMYKKNDIKLFRSAGEDIFRNVSGQIKPIGEQPTGGYNVMLDSFNRYVTINNKAVENNPLYIFKIDPKNEINLNNYTVRDSNGTDISSISMIIYHNKAYVHKGSTWFALHD